MKRNNTEIEDILNSFDGITKASARPFMHTRVMARLKEDNSFFSRSVNFFTRPAVALICISLILILNIVAVLKNNTTADESTTVNSSVAADVLQNDTYILASNY